MGKKETGRWRRDGERPTRGGGKKNARSERKAKQKGGARSKATEKSRGAVTRQVPSSGF